VAAEAKLRHNPATDPGLPAGAMGVGFLDKSPDAFRTISEAAEELDLPQHVLRFWETRFSQIKPMKRGGGRRYYRPADVDLLKGIRHLLYDKGFTIRGVQRILREQSIPHVVAIGRGEVEAGPEAAEPPRAGAKAKAKSAEAVEAAAAPAAALSEAQMQELRLAMEDLTAARELLAGAADQAIRS
jgi:DNA-binding transcriptional MerR regulator